MGFGDRIRGFFSRRNNPDLARLEDFARTHQGVEGYVEPLTATQPTTLLLVDRVGAHVRGAVADPRDAFSFCEGLGLPVYDAAVIGYPKRMKDFAGGRKADPSALDEQIADLERRLSEPE
ncbi:MAG TPA: hypothetical protein VNP73_01275 [Actinomycetota bacterium]|nr:hypothetical protein [Actinomycetota bacterium]